MTFPQSDPIRLRPRTALAGLAAALAVSLAACGGGGGDVASASPTAAAAAPAAPGGTDASTPSAAGVPTTTAGVDPGPATQPAPTSLTATATPKQFALSWTAAAQATGYRLQRKVGGGDWTDVGSPLADTTLTATVDLAVHLTDWAATRYRVRACGAAGCGASPEVQTIDWMLDAIGRLQAATPGATDKFGLAVALSADGGTLAVGAPDDDSNSSGIGNDETNDAAADAGAVHVFVRGATGWVRQAYVKASNTGAGDGFGRSVALSADGSMLVVGAAGEDSASDAAPADNTAADSGAVYVFTRTNAAWTQQAYVKATTPGAGDGFGAAVSLTGDGATLAVAAPGEDGDPALGDADNSMGNSGAVYVFTRSGATWSQQVRLKASNAQAGDEFGRSAAISSDGTTLAVGATREDGGTPGVGGNESDESAPDAGAVYVFVRGGSVWSQQAYVKASNADSSDQFGTAVALSANGDTLAVGASGERGATGGINGDGTSNSAAFAGAAYVFMRTGSNWAQQAYVKASNARGGSRFGQHLALSADGALLAVGAYIESSSARGVGGDQGDTSTSDAGAVYVFGRSVATWTQRSYVKGSVVAQSDQFGTSVALSADGGALAVGAPLAIPSPPVGTSGSVFVY
ncbi:MAG: integrin [Burkholderiales bacterium]|nr:MAG: integrin [Burkholderiales bacterium]